MPALLALWTLAAGPAHAGCDDVASDLSVVTFNTWGLPSPVARDRRGRLPRIASWLEQRGYDIAGLQEVWRGAVSLLPLPSIRREYGGDSGLALVTPHPVSNAVQHTFQAERGFDRFKSKGLMTTEVWVDEREPLVVGVTHLQAGGAVRNARVRADQVEEILGQVGGEDRPVLLMGDFNLYEGSDVDAATRDRLEAAGFVDVAAVAGATQGTYPGGTHRFDRIYVRDGKERCLVPSAAKVLDGDLSDHHAVEAALGLGE